MSAQSQNTSEGGHRFEPEEGAQEGLPSSPENSDQGNFSVVNQEIPAALEQALVRTMGMIEQHNLASAEDCTTVSAKVRRNWESGKGSDPIDCLARLRAGDGDMLDASVDTISSRLAYTLPMPPTRIPFACRLIPPTSVYEKNPDLELMCRLMQVPIAYAEDLDVIGIGSINPYFVDALSAEISQYAKEKTGIHPLISHIRFDYVGWAKMCQKHFREGPVV